MFRSLDMIGIPPIHINVLNNNTTLFIYYIYFARLDESKYDPRKDYWNLTGKGQIFLQIGFLQNILTNNEAKVSPGHVG